MVQEIELPDGEIVEFPDEMSDDQISQVLSADLGVRRAEEVSGQSPSPPVPLGDAVIGQAPSQTQQFDRPAGGPTPLERLGGFVKGTARVAAEIGAAFIPGLAAVRAVNVAAKVAPRVGKVLQKATVFSKGGGFKGGAANILRAAGSGAAGGAATETILGRDAGTGALAGAAGGPLGLGAGVTFKAAKAFMADPKAKGLIVIAKKLDVTPEEIGKRFLDFKAIMGRNPSIIEIADDQSVAEIRNIIARTASATAVARESVETIAKTRAGEFAGVVSGGRVTTTAVRQKALQKARADVQFGALREKDITLSEDALSLLDNPNLRDNVTQATRREIDDAVQAAGRGVKRAKPKRTDDLATAARKVQIADEGVPGEPVVITGELADFIRQDLKVRAGSGSGSKQRVLEIKRQFEAAVGESSPEFSAALDEFASRAQRAEGVTAGRKLVTQDTSEALAGVEAARSASVAAGTRVGARSELEDVAQESLGKAGRLAQDLSKKEGLVERLSAVLKPDELAQLQAAGAAEAKALENIGSVAPAIKARGGKTVDNALRAAIGAVAVAGTNVGGAFKVGEFFRITALLPPFLSKKARDSLARDVLDPTKTKAVISALKTLKLRDGEILDLFATAAAAGSQAAQAVGN